MVRDLSGLPRRGGGRGRRRGAGGAGDDEASPKEGKGSIRKWLVLCGFCLTAIAVGAAISLSNQRQPIPPSSFPMPSAVGGPLTGETSAGGRRGFETPGDEHHPVAGPLLMPEEPEVPARPERKKAGRPKRVQDRQRPASRHPLPRPPTRRDKPSRAPIVRRDKPSRVSSGTVSQQAPRRAPPVAMPCTNTTLTNRADGGCPKALFTSRPWAGPNNQILSLLGALEFGRTHMMTYVIPPLDFFGKTEDFRLYFDLSRFSQYYCFVFPDELDPDDTPSVRIVNGEDLYYARTDRKVEFLRPAASIRHEVTRFVEKSLPQGYVAFHQRLTTSKGGRYQGIRCVKEVQERTGDFFGWTTEERSMHAERCTMPVGYVRNVMKEVGDGAKSFFIGSDTPKVARNMTGCVVYNGTGRFAFHTFSALLVEMFVMADARVFVGNPASTVSYIVCKLQTVNGGLCLHPGNHYDERQSRGKSVCEATMRWSDAVISSLDRAELLHQLF